MKNKNLLFLCPSYPAVGGVEAVTSLLADFFLGKGYKVFILVSGTDKLLGATLDKHINLMTILQGADNSNENLEFIDRFIREKEIACVFNQGVFSISYLHANLHEDVLFINSLHSCPFWEVERFRHSTLRQLLLLEKTTYQKIKVLVRFLLNRVKPGMSHPSIESFYRQQIEHASFYVVLDQAYKTTLENSLYGGIKQEKIRVIPDPLVLPEATSFPKQKKVLYVGRLTGEPKRVDRLLRIWQKVQSQSPDWDLLIVGDGDQRDALEKLARQLRLVNVTFLGYQNPGIYYQEASILCLTSTYEGFGMVLTEAQSYGTVPVSFNCSDAIDGIIDQGVNGLIIDPFDENSFAEELISLIRDDKRREVMSLKAKEKSMEYDIERIGQLWLDLLH